MFTAGTNFLTTSSYTTSIDLAVLACCWGAVAVITGETTEARIAVAFPSQRAAVAAIRRGRRNLRAICSTLAWPRGAVAIAVRVSCEAIKEGRKDLLATEVTQTNIVTALTIGDGSSNTDLARWWCADWRSRRAGTRSWRRRRHGRRRCAGRRNTSRRS